LARRADMNQIKLKTLAKRWKLPEDTVKLLCRTGGLANCGTEKEPRYWMSEVELHEYCRNVYADKLSAHLSDEDDLEKEGGWDNAVRALEDA
jgi:hypothetical protein